MQLDIFTVIVLEIASAALVGLVLPSARDATKLSGFRETVWAAWLGVGAFAAQLLRNKGYDFVPIVLGNGAMWLATALHVWAYERFDGRRAPTRSPLVVVGASLLVMLALWATGASYMTRAIVTSLTLATTTLQGARVLARDGGLERERSRSICIGLGALVGVCNLARIGLLLANPPHDADMLHPSLERSIAFFPALLYTLGSGLGFLVMHRERSEVHARELSLTDPMTGCANRRALEDRVRGELAHARRSGKPISLIVTDIDHFKKVNDTHGHAVGDQVIRHIASTLRGGVHASDVVARYGGEEFCVLLRDVDLAAACLLAERLREAVRSLPVVTPQGELRVTSSFGVATYDVGAKETWESLFHRADAALYNAKQGGRDRVASDARLSSTSSLPQVVST